jgi:hypothetical protein
MESTSCDISLVECLEQYLLSYGEGSMQEITRLHPHLYEWAREHDILGWDNFMEGRIGTRLFLLQEKQLLKQQSRWTIKTWGTQFIQRVLSITHHQWLFRNARVHIRLVEGKTSEEHHTVMTEVLERLTMTTDDLLPEHQHLLEIDFKGLGEGSTLDRQYWLANMDSAVRAATWQRNMELQRGRHRFSMACNDVTMLDRT